MGQRQSTILQKTYTRSIQILFKKIRTVNIFYLHRDPVKAAQVQYDKHVVKMILESAQMLCTAHHVYGNPDDVPYKQAHLNHPSTIWARESRPNYYWLYNHMIALGKEYTKRYGKIHMTIDKCRWPLSFCPDGIESVVFTEPPQAMPDQYKVPGCSITAYWNYYEGEKYSVANKKEKLITRDILYEQKTSITLN